MCAPRSRLSTTRILSVGERDGIPMVTFTGSVGFADAHRTAPSPAYTEIIGEGIRESHGWDATAITDYLSGIADLEVAPLTEVE